MRQLSLPAHVLQKSVRLEGPGLHTGQMASLEIRPAPAGHGLRFVRGDLAGRPSLAAHISLVHFEQQCTGLKQGAVEVLTVEHLLAALAGLGIWDAALWLEGPEVPILDGSAAPFVEALLDAGLRGLDRPMPFMRLCRSVRIDQGDRWIELAPADRFELDCLVDFDHPLLHKQRCKFVLGRESFVRELAPARTFGFLRDLEKLRRAGLAQGGSLDNAVVIDDFSVLNEEGLRFPDEFARHKALDILGDLALLGMPLLARVRAHKSGHALHHELLRALFKDASGHAMQVLPAHDCESGLAVVSPPEPQQA